LPADAGTARRGPALSLAWARAIPIWAWLTTLVLVSAAIRFQLARGMVAPWIMVDELIYSELAKSFAATGHFAVRGNPTGLAFGFVYPILISPAWKAFGSIPQAYAAAKAINSMVMSLAAVPAYFLARRLMDRWLALLAAVLTVAVPSMAYTGTLMTENAFYPLFLATTLAFVAYLERPSLRHALLLLLAFFFTFETRTQAIAFVPAILVAPALLSLLDRRGLRGLRDHRWLYGIVGGLGLLVVAGQAARGRSPLAVLGVYQAAGQSHYRLADVARWFLYHLAELDLYLGFVPFAALLLLIALGPRLPRAHRAFVAATVPLVVFLLLVVAAFASHDSLRIEERNMFYVAPLFLIALLAWIDLGAPRPALAAGAAAVAAAALPGVLPFTTLIGVSVISDTQSLIPLWWLQDTVITLQEVQTVVVLAAVASALLFLIVPRRAVLVLPALVLLFFTLEQQVIQSSRHGIDRASVGALFSGIGVGHRDWIDRAVGRDANVVALTSDGYDRRFTIWQNEMFNRSVGRVYGTGLYPLPGAAFFPQDNATFHETKVVLDPRTGAVLTPDGRPVTAGYVLADELAVSSLVGKRIAADDSKEMALLRVNGPLRARSVTAGLYPADTWSGKTARYTRFDCTGGILAVTLGSDPGLFKTDQTVVARVGGQVVGTASVPPEGTTILNVPLTARDGRCVVDFAVGRTAVPAVVTHGKNTDTRPLGVHFNAFDLVRSR
jgi:Dolichyl-phosphate-mannose-protein mannosyltransferase